MLDLHLDFLIPPSLTLAFAAAFAAAAAPVAHTRTPYDFSHDELENPEAKQKEPGYPDSSRWGDKEHTEGHLDKANQDDAQTPNPVDPLPDFAVNTLCSVLLDVWTAIGWKIHIIHKFLFMHST